MWDANGKIAGAAACRCALDHRLAVWDTTSALWGPPEETSHDASSELADPYAAGIFAGVGGDAWIHAHLGNLRRGPKSHLHVRMWLADGAVHGWFDMRSSGFSRAELERICGVKLSKW